MSLCSIAVHPSATAVAPCHPRALGVTTCVIVCLLYKASVHRCMLYCFCTRPFVQSEGKAPPKENSNTFCSDQGIPLPLREGSIRIFCPLSRMPQLSCPSLMHQAHMLPLSHPMQVLFTRSLNMHRLKQSRKCVPKRWCRRLLLRHAGSSDAHQLHLSNEPAFFFR